MIKSNTCVFLCIVDKAYDKNYMLFINIDLKPHCVTFHSIIFIT